MTTEIHSNVRRVADVLAQRGAAGEVTVLAESAPTAAAAAAQLDCEVGAIANSLVFNADGAPLLVLTSGAHRADLDRLAKVAGVSEVRKAKPDFVREHTGQPIGGVAPIGHPVAIRTLIDTWLAEHDRVWASAGHPYAVFPTTYDELIELTGAVPVDV